MACCCLGPQNGEPLCPCQMRSAGAYIEQRWSSPPSLSRYTDAEISAEHHRRMIAKLGDQSVGVTPRMWGFD